jgi:Na+/phosphate symporter
VLIAACVKLEQVGDIIVRNLLVQVQKKVDRGLEFTGEGWSELVAFHSTVLANARLAFNVLVSRDRETAWQLVREKEPAARPRETLEPEPFRTPARRHGEKRRDQLDPSRHDPRPQADQLAARVDPPIRCSRGSACSAARG